jgi:hypothetical protein
MGLTARKAQTWRARSRAGVALVVLVAWFGTLLVAAPTTSPASAASSTTVDPAFTAPPAAGTTNTPSFAFSANGVNDPVECGWAAGGSTAPTQWDPCSSPYAPVLTDAEGTYDIWIRSVHTPVDPGLPDSPTVGIDLTPVPSDGVSTAYVIDRTNPVVTLQLPAPTAPTSTAGWVFTSSEPASITCVLSGGPTTASGPCGPGDVFPGSAVADGSYTITATATLGSSSSTVQILPSSTEGQLVIDTTGPTITNVSINAAAGKVTITYRDTGTGLIPQELLNPAIYVVKGPGGRRNVAVAMVPGGSTGTTSVILTLNQGQTLKNGRYSLSVLGSGITDAVGNSLNGTFTLGFPTGISTTRGNFDASFHVHGGVATALALPPEVIGASTRYAGYLRKHLQLRPR